MEAHKSEEVTLATVLAEHGVTAVDQEWHRSWRCFDKDRYPGDRGCLPELLADLEVVIAARVAEAKAEALGEAADYVEHAGGYGYEGWVDADKDLIAYELRDRARGIRNGASDA
jgi:hypothetical protein